MGWNLIGMILFCPVQTKNIMPVFFLIIQLEPNLKTFFLLNINSSITNLDNSSNDSAIFKKS